MLVTTLSAFALDFTDYRKVTLGSYTPTESNDAKLSVTDNGDGTYNVTFNDIINKDRSYTDNYGTFTFSNVSGSTSGDVTTVTGTNLTGTVSGGDYGIKEFTSGNLSLKFKEGKAYATMTATCRVFYSNYNFDVVFGTDEGFDGGGSTGGGETGGETSSIVTVKENFQSTELSSWGENVTIDWNTQKLVVSVNLASTGSDRGFLGVTKKGQTAGWNNSGIIFYNTNSSTVQGYAPGTYNNSNTGQVTKGEDPVRFEISKDGGVKCQGNVVISASNIAHLTNQSEIVVGAADKAAGAFYNYIKVVPLDWAEVPPVTVDETVTYDKDAYVGTNGTNGTANVKVNKLSDGSYTMEITAPVATKVGEISVSEDVKGRTTYMGEVESATVSGVKYLVHGVVYTAEDGTEHLYMTLSNSNEDVTYIIGENPDAPKVVSTLPFENVAYTTSYNESGNTTVTFTEMSDGTFPMTFVSENIKVAADNLTKATDAKGRTTYTGTAKRTDVTFDVTFTVKAVVYGESDAQKLYMTMDNGSGFVVTVGENPDRAAYKNTLYVVENAKLLVETAEAEVVLQDKGDNKYDVTLPAFTAGEMNVASITFEATKADNKLTASNVSVPDVYSGDAAVVTMDGTFESDGKLFASLTVKCGSWFNYEVGYGIKPFVATTKEYTAEWANVKVGDAEPVNFQNAKADYTEFAKGQYSLTFKDLTFGEKKIGDFTIKYVNMDSYGELSTTASAGEWTRVEADQDVASLGDMPAISGFEGVIGGTGVLKVKFTIGAYGTVAVDFGNKYEAPKTPDPVDVVEDGFKATGSSWKKEGVAIDWDTQYIAAKLDLSTCKTSSSPENVLAVGTDITGWNDGPHYFFYYNKADKVLQYNYLHKANSSYNSGFANLSKAYIQLSDEVVTIEISKQGGLKINGESALVKYVNTAKDPSTNSTESWTTEDLPTVFSGLWALNTIDFGGCQGTTMSNATYKYVKVVPLGWTEPVTPPSVEVEKTFNETLYMGGNKAADAKVVVKEMSDETVNMSLQFSGYEYTSTELTKGTDEKNRTTYTGKVANGEQTYDVKAVVYEKDNAERLYMTMITGVTTVVVGENPDVVTPEVTEVSNKTYTSNLRILDGETTVVEEAEANVNIIKYSDESYKVTLKNVNMLNKTQDLVFVGKVITDVTDSEAPLTIMAKSDEATTNVFGEQVSGTFEITEVSADEIKMGFSMESQNFSYQGEFNYTEEEEPEVYTNNLHIYDAAAPETDLFQADQAKVEFLATETGEFKLTLKDVTLNEKTQDLVFTGALPTPQPGGQDPLAEEGETTPAEPAMVLNATADEATATFLGTTSATAVFNVIMNDEAETENDAFALTFTITAGEKTLGGEFNYEKKDPDTPDPELFCKENYVADGTGFEWDINVDWDTQKIVMSIDPSTCTGSCEHVIGLGASPTTFHGNLHLYRTNDQQLQGYFETSASNNNTGKFAETAPFLVEVSKAQGFVVNNEVKIASSAMSYLFTLSTVKMGTGEGSNDKSRATYNYVKVVDKDWTAPKDPDTGINATTVAEGEVEFFTVNGVKLNKLQKGLNIVRTADGKVKKVLVK